MRSAVSHRAFEAPPASPYASATNPLQRLSARAQPLISEKKKPQLRRLVYKLIEKLEQKEVSCLRRVSG